MKLKPSSNQAKNAFKGLKKLFSAFKKNLVKNGPKSCEKLRLTGYSFCRYLGIFGTFFKVHFLDKYTSNEAKTKLKTLFKPSRSFFAPLKKISKMVQNRQKVKVNYFTFCRNLAIFGTFFKVHFLNELYVQ